MRPELKKAIQVAIKATPRKNPPGDDEGYSDRVSALAETYVRDGKRLSDVGESELMDALEALGVPDEQIASQMETLASWEE